MNVCMYMSTSNVQVLGEEDMKEDHFYHQTRIPKGIQAMV